MKKLFIILLLLAAPVVLYVACICRCPVQEDYYKVNSINLISYGNGNIPVTGGTPVNVDTINFRCIFLTSCVASSHKNPFSYFVNQAYACKCVGCGNYGLKSKIKSITISSDSAYSNSLPPNTSLNSLFTVKRDLNSSTNQTTTIDSIIQEINTGSSFTLRDNLLLFITKKPSASLTHRFKFIIEFENTDKFELATAPITWF